MTDTPISPVPDETSPAIFLRAQYIKDISFENPRAPASLFALREKPAMDVSVNLGAQRLDEKNFELSIQISCRAVVEKTTVFLCDLVYSGVIEMQNVPEEAFEPILFVQGAYLLFPYARRVISDVTRDGGFPPLQLDPMDFHMMYQTQHPRAKAAADATSVA
jgi:preprotein translocase subunit SecB